MKPFPFEYRIAETTEEAVTLLADEGSEAKIIAGGQSLGPMLNYHLVRPDYLIDINRATELNYIVEEGGFLRIGATATEVDIENSALVRQHVPLLVTATTHIGFPSIRHRGTIGGSVAHNDPAAEYPATLLALDAMFDVVSLRGRRTLSATDLFADRFLETTADVDEMIVGVAIPISTPTMRPGFAEFQERAGDFATAGVSTVLTMNEAGNQIVSAAIAAFGGLYPARLRAAEDALAGAEPSVETFSEAAAAVGAEFAVGSDVHGSARYRRRLIETLAKRALAEAAALQPTG